MPLNRQFIPARLLLLALLVACGVVLCACESRPEPDRGKRPYRTIQAQPLRDTDAARKANEQGLMHLDKGELYQAEQAFLNALEADVGFGPAHNNLGKIYFLKRDFYRAAHEFDTAIDLIPSHAAPHNNLGLTLLESGKLDDAVDTFRKATTLAPNVIEYQANLARTLVQRGDTTNEVITLLRAVALRDDRLEWRIWASHQLGTMGAGVE